MKVQILGSGCDKCKKLAANAEAAAAKLGAACEIEKVTDINRITEFGVMMTPALVVDGKVVSVGKVLTPEEIGVFMRPSGCDCGGACEVAPEAAAAAAEPVASCSCGGTAEAAGTPASCRETGGGKKILRIALLLLVAASVIFVIAREMKPAGGSCCPGGATPAIPATPPAAAGTLVVYYFHGTQRCFTCNKIESLTRSAIESKYAAELASGSLVFKSVNVDEPANEHFIQDFQLSTRSVVMQKDGKYERFDAVWTLVGQPEKFIAYIQDGVAAMSGAKNDE
jgi:small redox-active disulfide protein 2